MKIYKPYFKEMAWLEFSAEDWYKYTVIFKRYVTRYKTAYTNLLDRMKDASKTPESQKQFLVFLETKIAPLFWKDHKLNGNTSYQVLSDDFQNLIAYFQTLPRTELSTYNIVSREIATFAELFAKRSSLLALLSLFDSLDLVAINKNPVYVETMFSDIRFAIMQDLDSLTTLNSHYNKVDRLVKEYTDKKILFTNERPENILDYKGIKYSLRTSKKITKDETAQIPSIQRVIKKFIDKLEKFKLLKHMETRCDKIVFGDSYALLKTSGKESESSYYAYYNPTEHTIYMPIKDVSDIFYEHAFFHETGHLFLNYIKDHGKNGRVLYDRWHKSFDVWKQDRDENFLPSDYAWDSPHEAFAEVFSSFYDKYFTLQGKEVAVNIKTQFLDMMRSI